MKVVSLPLDKVIKDIAKALETKAEVIYGEYKVTLPKNIGTGTIRGINLDRGLGIIQYDCTFNEDMEIQFVVNKVHPLKFLYIIDGKLYHRFANQKIYHELERFQNAIVASSDSHGHILNFKKQVHTRIFSVEINREKFREVSGAHSDGMDPKLKKLLADTSAKNSFYYEGDYSLKMADVFKKIEQFEGSEFLYGIFMESVAFQTLVQQMSQYIDDQRHEKNRTILRRSEIDGVKKAADYIHQNIEQYQSLPELVSHTGLNSAKLQEGFKHLYDKTVNQYVHDTRLAAAEDLLIETDDSISEIVFKIGLSSKSYFSRIFKEHFGVLPSAFRKKKQK